MLLMVDSSSVNGHYRHEANEGGTTSAKMLSIYDSHGSSIRPYQQVSEHATLPTPLYE